MKLSSGKRIGQSGQELATAVSFSFFLHVLFFLAAVFLYVNVKPRIHVPPLYNVKLVALPADESVPPAAQSAPPQPAPVQPAKPAPMPKTRKEHRSRATAKKGELPGLEAVKKRPSPPADQEKSADEQRTAPATPPGGAPPGGVAVTTTQENFPFAWYLVGIRNKIGQNWSPPPDARDAKARVTFTINRSGWVGEVTLVADQSTGTFGFKQAAMRAIQRSNPFPALPEDFSKQTLQFTVDLMAVD